MTDRWRDIIDSLPHPTVNDLRTPPAVHQQAGALVRNEFGGTDEVADHAFPLPITVTGSRPVGGWLSWWSTGRTVRTTIEYSTGRVVDRYTIVEDHDTGDEG